MKLTRKAIQSYKEIGAIDISGYSFDEMNNLIKEEGSLERVHYSLGTYGLNGLVLKGWNSGKTYIITRRTLAIEMV